MVKGEFRKVWSPLVFDLLAVCTSTAPPLAGSASTLNDSSAGMDDWASVTTAHSSLSRSYHTPIAGSGATAMHGQVAPRYGLGVTNSTSPGWSFVTAESMCA